MMSFQRARRSLRVQAGLAVLALTMPLVGLAVFLQGRHVAPAGSIALMLAGGGAVALIGFVAAAGIVRRINAAMRALSTAAAELDPTQLSPAFDDAGLAQIDTVTRSIGSAAATLAVHLRERDAAEARLRRSEQHLARAQKVADIGSFERSFETDAIYWSDNIYGIYGVDKSKFAVDAESIIGLIHPEDRTAYRIWRDLSAEESQVHEYRIIRPDGEQRIMRAERESIRNAAGRLIALVGTTRDVTEARAAERRQRELETQLRHSQRLEALGTLAGGIAHDLNNTLTPIVALPKRMARQLADQPALLEKLRLIEEAGIHARDLVRQILSFSRKDAPAREPVDLAAFISELLPMLRATSPSTVRVEFTAPASLPSVLGDRAQLRQVLVNLVANAVHAIGGETGTVTIALEPAIIGPTGAVHLVVADTGGGMSQATLDRIFEPFFTTKAPGEGTGLGLSVVHGIIASHGGEIRASSQPGHGTRFEIRLPAAESDVATLAGAA